MLRVSIPRFRRDAYLIDAALLKGHVSSGVTLSAKNLFGASQASTPTGTRTRMTVSVTIATVRQVTPAFVDYLGP